MADSSRRTAEDERLLADQQRDANWKRWGPYLPERQWGTVREDYSGEGDTWNHFPHEHARSRVYRWGEDGLLGITDRQCRLCFAPALWNGRDPMLKERLFGLTGPQGNHGEDVKEVYFYVDATPTHSYLKALYKYPQAEFPYQALVDASGERGRGDPEPELRDLGTFDGGYFDLQVEYAKVAPEDVLIKLTVTNRGDAEAPCWLLPQIWFRNTWSWGRSGEGYSTQKPSMRAAGGEVEIDHEALGRYRLAIDPEVSGAELAFTENESNFQRLWGQPNRHRFVKDAFHDLVVEKKRDAVNPAREGTKAAWVVHRTLAPGKSLTVRLRLWAEPAGAPRGGGFGEFDRTLEARREEADAFHAARAHPRMDAEERRVMRQAYAGLLWTKQFYAYAVREWLEGDPAHPPPPKERKQGRNADWPHLYNRDVISVPDKWEYPWYAAWDLAFHMVPFARMDLDFAKEQLILFLREWYMHPNGQLPAYEFGLSDVNPPVHAWSCWRVYKASGPDGQRDRMFLERAFQKLLLNFTWWVNRKDVAGKHLFSGGFLGLDNIGVFDRSKPLPTGGALEQADGTAWMAFFCASMLRMAMELARWDAAYEDIASKFFEHFIAIADAMNTLGGTGLWDEEDGFYYDQLSMGRKSYPLRIRSMVGLVPLTAAVILEDDVVAMHPGFQKRLNWFVENRPDLAAHIAYLCPIDKKGQCHRLLAIPSEDRLRRVLRYAFDEKEFLSPYGIRSLSRVHLEHPFELNVDGEEYRVQYVPGESDSGMFGGNSNWRGPVWFPLNFLLVEALARYHRFYGDGFTVEYPTGSGRQVTLDVAARDLAARLSRLFLPGEDGRRPCHGDDERFASDPHWRDLVLFYEYFDGDTGRGVGASHQTGWTALVTRCLEIAAEGRAR
ncbi:MAG TPA: glucosidase [Myxococcaceae bacterium]|jgi:hypothetical protein